MIVTNLPPKRWQMADRMKCLDGVDLTIWPAHYRQPVIPTRARTLGAIAPSRLKGTVPDKRRVAWPESRRLPGRRNYFLSSSFCRRRSRVNRYSLLGQQIQPSNRAYRTDCRHDLCEPC